MFNAYLILIFIITFSGRLVSMGTMFSQAMGSIDPILRTSMVVGSQTLAALFALYVANSKHSDFSNVWLLVFFTPFLSLILFYAEGLTPLWFVIFFLHQAIFNLISTLLTSGTALFDDQNILMNNRKVQAIISATFVLSLGLSPVLITNFNIKYMYLLQALAFIVTAIPLKLITSNVILKNKSERSINKCKDEIENLFKISKHKYIYIFIFLVWISGGVFSIIEIPLLKYRFSFTTNQISILFVTYACLNLLGISFFPKKLLANKAFFSFKVASLLVLLSSISYLVFENIYIVVFIVLLFGLCNGIFTVSYTTILLNIKNEGARNKSLLVSNLISRFGMLVTVLYFLLIPVDIKDISSVIIFASIIFLVGLGVANVHSKKTIS